MELESLNVLKYPLITEKAVNMIEAENKLVFVVDNRATKVTVKKAVESLYKVKVRKVNMLKDMKGKKRAIVRLMKEFKAGNVATKLGVI
ncbi:MAG: 50S ribosomal protein L23 [archaeon]